MLLVSIFPVYKRLIIHFLAEELSLQKSIQFYCLHCGRFGMSNFCIKMTTTVSKIGWLKYFSKWLSSDKKNLKNSLQLKKNRQSN